MREDDLFPDISYPDPPARIRSAAAKIRSLRSQVGHEGLTPSATRTLVDELASALDEVARALGSRDS
jgi:cytosine/adenosine deaminase-related metal-dependent hydrolase